MIKGVSLDGVDSKVVSMLGLMAQHSSFDLVVTSAFRSVEHEKSKGRDGSSSHCKGLAVDIAVKDSFERMIVLYTAICSGFPRIGISKTFIHLDMDFDKPSPRIWLY